MADLTNDTETQSFDTQSPSSPSSSGNELKDGNEYEYRLFQSTVPFDDTVVLDVDTEELNNLNCVGNMRTLLTDEYEEEVVLDSDDEGRIYRPEVVGAAKGLSFHENGRRVRGDALDLEKMQLSPPREQDNDGASAGGHCSLGYSRRVSSSVHAHSWQASGLAAHIMTYKGNDNGSTFIQTDTESQKQLVLKDDGISRVKDQYLVDTNLKEVVLDHDNWECSGGMKDKLNGDKKSLSKIESTDGKKDLSQPLAFDHELGRLNYVGSQEIGESSQANALDFVDQFLSCNNVDLSHGVGLRKTVKEKSPPVSIAKGPQSLAKRIDLRTSTRKTGTFEWVDNHQDGGGDFSSKRMEAFFDCGGYGQRYVTRPQKARHLVNKGGGSSGNECEKKAEFLNPHKKIMGSTHSDSRFMVHNSKEIGKIVQVSEMKIEKNFVKELNEQLDAESSEQQLETNGIGRDTQDMCDVFNTQMAAEVMEALLYAPPANCSTDDAYQGRQNTLEDSLRGVTKDKAYSEHPSFQKRASSSSGSIARKSKRIKMHPDKLSIETSSSAQKPSKKLKELDSELKVRTKEKRAKSLAENELNCRNLANVSESSGRRSSRTIGQRKAEGTAGRDNIKEGDKYFSSSVLVEHTPPGKGQSQGKCRNFSPISWRTRQSMSASTLNRNKGQSNNSGEGMSDVMEIGVLKHRTRRSGSGANAFEVLSVRGKCPKLSSNTSEEARNRKLSQEEQTGVGVAASTSCLKLDIWSYPRRKRTRRNMPGHSNVASNLYTTFTVVDGVEGNDHSIKHQKRSKGNAKTTFVNLDMKRKTRSSVYTFPSWYSSEKNSKGSFLRKNFDNPGSADVSNCESAAMNKRMFLLDMVSAKASLQSGKLDDMDSILSADGAEKNHKFEVLSIDEVKQSGSECTTSVNCTKGSNVASPSYMGYGYQKQPCNKNLPRASLIKELIQLGVPELIPNFSSKELRRRRDMANIRVLFSQHLDDDIIKQQKKILARLGISISSCSLDATHFITDEFVRTRNMLEAIALGKPVVTHLWLESCGQASCFISEKNYILRDAKKEKEIGFRMPISLARASQHPLLKGQRVFITPNIKPGKEMIASLVKAVHGQEVEKIQKSATKDEKILDDLLILSCEEDYAICVPFLDKGAAVYSSELLLNGIVIQKLEYGRHQLFRNHVKRNCSSIWSRKDANLSVPVSKCK